MQADAGEGPTKLLARLDVAIGVLLLVSAGGCYAAWAGDVGRPEHHGEVAFLFIYAAWAVIPGIAFIGAGLLTRRPLTRGQLVVTHIAALSSPIVSWLLFWRVLWGAVG
jgi:hypothetical protein